MKNLSEKDWDKAVKATLRRRGKITRSKQNKSKNISRSNRTKSNDIAKIKRKFG